MKITGTKRHNFVCSDTLLCQFVHVDENGNIVNQIGGIIGVFDLWVLPEGNILYAPYKKMLYNEKQGDTNEQKNTDVG